MFWDDTKFQEKYYHFFYKLFNFKKDVKIVPVDFQKPWWQVIWSQKWYFILDVFSEVVQSIYDSLTPLIIGLAIFNRDLKIIIYFSLGYVVLEVFNRFVLKLRSIYIMGASQSIAYWSYRYFLTVDPIFHTTKSSGQIISKIGRGSNDFIDLMLSILGSIIPVVTGFVTIIITLAKYNLELGVVSLVAFISISIVNGVMGIAGAKSFKKQVIKVQDKVSSVVVENLQQNALIRSTFATTEQDQKNKQLSLDTMVVRATMWLGFGVSITVTRLLYVLASFILAVLIIKFIDQGVLKPEVGLTLLVTFVNGSNQILMLGRTLRDLTDKYLSITDLFDFIRSFGKQTYPVLEGELPPSLTV